MMRKKPVSLNMGVGTLTLYANQTIEFKSAGPHTAHNDSVSIAPSSISEVRSQYIEDRARNHSNSLNVNGQTKDNKIASLLKNENSPQQDYTHLSNFLK